MRRGAGIALVVATVLAVVVTVGLGRRDAGPDGDQVVGPYCEATVDGHLVETSLEQAQNAALIVAVAVRRGLPARAASIALATAYQESGLVNLDYGDRDSLGLFQQRPSQGWGTPAEIRDPEHAANAFYDALERVSDYRDLQITVAAQQVQHSAYPGAYADHEADARVLASALTGNSPGAFSCHLPDGGTPGSRTAVRRAAGSVFGSRARLVSPSGVDVHAGGRTHGWALAAYFVARAQGLGLGSVSYDGQVWRRVGGWTPAPGVGRDRVHVEPLL